MSMTILADANPDLPEDLALGRVYPNPFNPATTIELAVPELQHLRVEICDILGHRVTLLADEVFTAGIHQLKWVAVDQPSGIYFARMLSESGECQVQRLLLVR